MKEKIAISIDHNILRMIDDNIKKGKFSSRSQAIEQILRRELMQKRTAVILNGGRYQNLIEKGVIRCLKEYKGKTIIEWQVETLKKEGFKEIYVVARKKTISEIINKAGINIVKNIEFIEEKTSKGNFESLLLVKEKIKNNFLLAYGDIYFKFNITEFLNFHKDNKSVCSIWAITSNDKKKRGEIVIRGNEVIEFNQIPKEKSLVYSSSIFYCSKEIFNYKGKNLEEDIFQKLIKENELKAIMLPGERIHFHEV